MSNGIDKNPLLDISKVYLNSVAESAVPGKPAEKLGAVTTIPKSEQEAAKERLLAKAKAKREKMKEAPDALKLTAQNLKEIGVVDYIVPEPLGGAHRDKQKIISDVEQIIFKEIDKFKTMSPKQIKKSRTDKFIGMGSVSIS